MSVFIVEGLLICIAASVVSQSANDYDLHFIYYEDDYDVSSSFDTDQVSPVNLTVVPVWSSPESCNMTVTCSSQDSYSVTNTFTCDNNKDTHHCSQQGGGERSEVVTSTGLLSVYMSEGSVICNHSNRVSWMKDTKEIKRLCELDSALQAARPAWSESVSVYLVKMVVFSVCLTFMVTAVTVVHVVESLLQQRD